jgi:hypothetical protein
MSGLQEEDKFHTPYTRWTGTAVAAWKLMATEFLNLMNGDWLRRPAGWVEVLALVISGVLLGGGLSRARPLVACGLAAGASLGRDTAWRYRGATSATIGLRGW